MFEITIIGFSIVIAFLVLLYFLANKANKIFDEIFDITKEESERYIKDFKTTSNELSEEIEKVNLESLEVIDKNSKIIEEISNHLSKVIHQLKNIETNLSEVDSKVIDRKNLENEIVKLKNIIKRLEKKNVQ